MLIPLYIYHHRSTAHYQALIIEKDTPFVKLARAAIDRHEPSFSTIVLGHPRLYCFPAQCGDEPTVALWQEGQDTVVVSRVPHKPLHDKRLNLLCKVHMEDTTNGS